MSAEWFLAKSAKSAKIKPDNLFPNAFVESRKKEGANTIRRAFVPSPLRETHAFNGAPLLSDSHGLRLKSPLPAFHKPFHFVQR